ncbi:MAG: Hsp20/alpha crystallin family protein [Deltaproteobacteria bacterium]|nr:Hsp20/alpha crystallin family protein [Deltaproteobacteria bacterium]
MTKKYKPPVRKVSRDKGDQGNPMIPLRRRRNALIDDFFVNFDLVPLAGIEYICTFTPRIDMSEDEKEIVVKAEMPGVERVNIQLYVTSNKLTIKGEKTGDYNQNGRDVYCLERSYGKFARTISLPAQVDTENVSASYDKGVLTVSLPKPKQKKTYSRKIPIKGG